MRSFSPGAMASIALRKSAPMCTSSWGACSYQSTSTARAELQQTSCTSLLLQPVDGTDRQTDGPLRRRLPHMRAAAMLQCAVINKIVAFYKSYVRYISLHADIVNNNRVVIGYP